MDFFKLKENKTNVKTEFNAAMAIFLSMLYIVPTNASILSATGMSYDALIIATTLVTIITTAMVGLFANTPIAMSTGMGLNVFFTYSMCLGQNIPWPTALGAVFISGFIFLVLSFTNFRVFILKSIPEDFRKAISAGIGCFLAFMGMNQAHIIQADPVTLIKIGNFADANVQFALFVLFLIVCFWAWNVRAGFILAVLIGSVIAWAFGINDAKLPENFIALPDFSSEHGLMSIFAKLDIFAALKIAILPAIMTLFVTQLFDSIGTITGAGLRGNLFENKSEEKEGDKKLGKTMIADAAGTCVGAVIGTSTATAFVESTAGIEAGGRTGLTSIFVALLFCLCIFFVPFFKAIPANAIYPILIMVGILMFMEVSRVDFKDPANCVATFFVVIMMPFTYSITTGIAFGFISYVLVRLLRKEFDKLNKGIIVITIICLAVFLLQFIKF
ncbi:NCS2 family permease [Campylobacter canadensis]|uniref:NCS2 family permease n=1 Tax=Campylobacter canadensis TaxID=449520 RepID=A0ABS7WS41_9BACT|nr:NCS2 family permease [Campylobacter canadensis]MBZ7987563.1 NCS2 family permease [Campylobacter canadensis]MBZ7994908.1 NCS2 family permease [Campylobacter canadensis]MBZ7996705.1 NCS2 family permease [Campylobacter canadensis]MBZ7998681.1 NCS2 family permease [Campylobacter canadensis]MBZ8000325.1 NCS2 family permease [Campylobacter canadensis]